ERDLRQHVARFTGRDGGGGAWFRDWRGSVDAADHRDLHRGIVAGLQRTSFQPADGDRCESAERNAEHDALHGLLLLSNAGLSACESSSCPPARGPRSVWLRTTEIFTSCAEPYQFGQESREAGRRGRIRMRWDWEQPCPQSHLPSLLLPEVHHQRGAPIEPPRFFTRVVVLRPFFAVAHRAQP